ncbi:hypothetical protein B4153_3442 [Bacillus cereus]|nr:hypothetical protein B4153_3442 [Bacillus cereus]
MDTTSSPCPLIVPGTDSDTSGVSCVIAAFQLPLDFTSK